MNRTLRWTVSIMLVAGVMYVLWRRHRHDQDHGAM